MKIVSVVLGNTVENARVTEEANNTVLLIVGKELYSGHINLMCDILS